ncbi:Na-translocating system protein MpsC family protein [Patulibacter sp.]|uniref:Na-translocating system protein MpsC family protein n=1 Tax=Patulibacter sp. TaxID=1912859 RepID=UPI00271FAA69|nr:Na-translocating system protein MpsC family protein [Patulibacter sp.]MDO9409360.1 Na-translocating system protein MpsC family protein [Patulibacter sp.]
MPGSASSASQGPSGPAPGPAAGESASGEQATGGEAVGAAAAISSGIVSLYKRYRGRGPTAVRTHLVGDLAVVLLTGGFTVAEQTLAREGHGDVVLEQRRAFQLVMAERFKALVREVTGREIVAMLSANHVDPDLAVETFVLGDRTGDTPRPALG